MKGSNISAPNPSALSLKKQIDKKLKIKTPK
jgi:hypothetical protein